jgi:tripartite-type tricarboxylate transporter receptor subunit TctC
MRARITAVVVLATLITSGQSSAEAYPNRPLRIIVPSASGGAPDIAARNLANELGSQLRQQVVVDNRPGASGIIGYEMIARAAPDGYTFGYIAFGFATNPSVYLKLPYDGARDLQPVILFASAAQILAVSPSLPIRSLKDLIDQARAKPGALSFGSSGNGTSQQLAMEMIKSKTDINMVHVAYKGIQQAITDVIGGQIQAVCDTTSSMLAHVRSGRLRALGITSLKRSPVLPELPTIDESGIAGFEMGNWGGYSVPARTPRDLVLRLNSELNKALLSPSVSKSIAERGSTPVGGTPEQFAEHLKRETAKWAAVIKAAGIKPQ